MGTHDDKKGSGCLNMITYNILQHRHGQMYVIVKDNSNMTPLISTMIHPIKENIQNETIIIENMAIGVIYIFEQYKNTLSGADSKYNITYIDCIK